MSQMNEVHPTTSARYVPPGKVLAVEVLGTMRYFGPGHEVEAEYMSGPDDPDLHDANTFCRPAAGTALIVRDRATGRLMWYDHDNPVLYARLATSFTSGRIVRPGEEFDPASLA
jgi:hypothetical protein